MANHRPMKTCHTNRNAPRKKPERATTDDLFGGRNSAAMLEFHAPAAKADGSGTRMANGANRNAARLGQCRLSYICRLAVSKCLLTFCRTKRSIGQDLVKDFSCTPDR